VVRRIGGSVRRALRALAPPVLLHGTFDVAVSLPLPLCHLHAIWIVSIVMIRTEVVTEIPLRFYPLRLDRDQISGLNEIHRHAEKHMIA
jgi:hypothetical protein